MKLGLVVLLVSSAPALADYHPFAVSPGEPPPRAPVVERGYLGGGAGASWDHFGNVFVDLEGGVRLATLPLWVRGSAAIGKSVDFEGGGAYRRFLAGLETRSCRGAEAGACLYLGLDAGIQTQTWSKLDEMPEHHRGWVYGTRVGLDAGGTATRFRIGVEAYRYQRTSDVGALPDTPTSGAGLTLAILHRL